MKERKLKIAEFVESIDGDKMSTSVLLGGAQRPTDDIMIKKNNEDCTNIDITCVGSRNGGSCENATGMCGDTTNRGSCKDTKPSDQPVNCSCA